MGEGSTWWESSTEPDPAFQFAFGRETSTASGPGRASSASASLLTFGQLSLIPPGKFSVLATSTSSDRVNEEAGGLLMPTTALAEATPLNSPGNLSEVTLADKSGLTTQETQSRLETVGSPDPNYDSALIRKLFPIAQCRWECTWPHDVAHDQPRRPRHSREPP